MGDIVTLWLDALHMDLYACLSLEHGLVQDERGLVPAIGSQNVATRLACGRYFLLQRARDATRRMTRSHMYLGPCRLVTVLWPFFYSTR